MRRTRKLVWVRRDWLCQKYWEENLSLYQIAKLCGVHKSTILNWMRKLKIERRGKGWNKAGRSKYGKNNSGLGACYSTYRAIAKKKGIFWGLTLEEFDGLSQGNCFYCGIAPLKVFAEGHFSKENLEKCKYIYNGIDRINSSGIYTIDNCVSCCKVCNFMKLKMTIQEFMNHIRRIYQWNLTD